MIWNPKPLYIFTSKEFLLLFYLDCLLSAYAYTSYAWQQVCNKWPERNKCILKNDQNHGRFSAAGWYAPILATQICRDLYTVERATFNAIEHVPPKTQHNDSKVFSLARPHYTLDIDEILIKNSLKLMVPQHAYSFNTTKFH